MHTAPTYAPDILVAYQKENRPGHEAPGVYDCVFAYAKTQLAATISPFGVRASEAAAAASAMMSATALLVSWISPT